MELVDEKVLETLLRDWEQRTVSKNRRPPSISRRCNCGVCRKCQENARWERIFQAKFADPYYYQRRSISHSSPLADQSL